MGEFLQLLRRNRNYRFMWAGQIVSEIGDNFNNIAVFALAMALTHSGMVVTGVLLARAIPAITVGPLAGVLLDRFDRKRIMIASDLVRAIVALGFILQRAADGGVAVLLGGPVGHPAHHRQPSRDPHRQLADADHAVVDAYGWNFSGRHRGGYRVQMGIRLQRAFVHLLRLVYLEPSRSRRSRLSRRTQNQARGRQHPPLPRVP
jgi:Transmembrane secretion effector